MDRPPTVLVVDDLLANREVLEAILAPRGYAVVSASSGEEALEKVRTEAPSPVLLDIVMPGMDGDEVCRRLRADERTRLLPVITLTASEDQEKARALEAGADDVIQKPLDQAELLARPVAAADQAVPRHDRGPGRRAGGLEWHPRGARARAGRRAGAARATAPRPGPAGGGADRLGRGRVAAGEPPARDRGPRLRPAGVRRLQRDRGVAVWAVEHGLGAPRMGQPDG